MSLLNLRVFENEVRDLQEGEEYTLTLLWGGYGSDIGELSQVNHQSKNQLC